jgi:hypothetical protein
MKSLEELAMNTSTDKGSGIHNYCVKYEKYLPFDRLKPIKVLEIGVSGGGSLDMWKGFYPNATIVGIDIEPVCKKYENIDKNIFVEIGSQYDPEFLNKVIEKYEEFDLIIDDGSHLQHHVIFSFEFLFNFIKSSGVYVVEDSCCSYWEEFLNSEKNNSSIKYFQSLVNDVNFYGQYQENFHPHYARREDYLILQTKRKNLPIRTDIESINFLNSLIIITKIK